MKHMQSECVTLDIPLLPFTFSGPSQIYDNGKCNFAYAFHYHLKQSLQ